MLALPRWTVCLTGEPLIQAGAGIVADSIPENENTECKNKAAAVITALRRAAQQKETP